MQQREVSYCKGGFSPKLHLCCEGNDLPVAFLLTVEERHKAVVFESLMKKGCVKRQGNGHPQSRSQQVLDNKGYSSSRIRCYLRRCDIRYSIPHRGNEKH